MKQIFFISTGRCGTVRLTQILQKKLTSDFSVVHQMKFSRLANVIGNIITSYDLPEDLKHIIFKRITSPYMKNNNFICTDPLICMTIPEYIIFSKSALFIHIVREAKSFANSMLSMSRKRVKSFIAHNFIPFWQPKLIPMENILSPKIKIKYAEISHFKNNFYYFHFSRSNNYVQVTMEELFSSNILCQIINEWFATDIQITEKELQKKANTT